MEDVEAIFSHRYDNGGDFWTTPDNRLLKGTPFSAYNSALMLLELGVEPDDPALKRVAELFLGTWKRDGRFQLNPGSTVYPCHNAYALNLLCSMGYSREERVQTALRHMLDTRHTDGGWRCSKFSFGRGPETEYSNPHPTLVALNAFRLAGCANTEPALNDAVDFLLWHWTLKKPLGPCHYGMGKLFMQVEYPFGNYNLFQYVYVLSFYKRARADARFREAFEELKSHLRDGMIVAERVDPKLARYEFCWKGEPSELATRRFDEIVDNIAGDGF